MPRQDGDVELTVVYYTDEELRAEALAAERLRTEALFAEGVALTQTADGQWTLPSHPAFDIELKVVYEDGSIETKPVRGATTGIATAAKSDGRLAGEQWYSLGGRQLPGKPATKGVYVSEGKKVVVK